ncbi:DUF3108 domain-containing protein [Dokdonia donghaensis]|uniref:ATP-dependent exonuclease n=1 Tax=Dokdonia donghaensis DSW-1 TaxID=1300343 RepID=A0A0A2GVV9_9FLAO|nr:DUF3108 domain-containing protein [Dokdonia donghaensis]ANH59282.1 hypothetical protein I597_0350 [Dokdonia donghaensis DSW-1]KGO06688.1 ATP-dependent exonuclease [Dokdonia donghaensis DSW-1]
MKSKNKHIIIGTLLAVFALTTAFVQMPDPPVTKAHNDSYQAGEWLKFRVHYGLLTGGYATIDIKDEMFNGKPVHHIKGYGETTGIVGLAFGVEDYYESWVDKKTDLPYKFLRKIDEGGHTKNKVIEFDQQANKAHINDLKHNKKTTIDTEPGIQDMVSAMYYLRNNLETEGLKAGDEINLTMFFDGENYPFKMRFLERETIRTKFGKVKTLVFRPLVQSGRVFKEQESLTIWVSDDDNKIPLRIKASLSVGSLKADLDAYKGLKYPFEIVFD